MTRMSRSTAEPKSTRYYKVDFGLDGTKDWTRYVLFHHASSEPLSKEELICRAGNEVSDVLAAEGSDALLYRYGEPQPINILHQKVNPDVQVGDTLLLGRFGGAYCNHYRVAAKTTDEDAVLVHVEPVSRKNDDGTFSTVWQLAQRAQLNQP